MGPEEGEGGSRTAGTRPQAECRRGKEAGGRDGGADGVAADGGSERDGRGQTGVQGGER